MFRLVFLIVFILFGYNKTYPQLNHVDDLLELLKLKKKEDHFLGISKTIGSNSVFGGQVLAHVKK